jgi:hypothetical protein
MDRTDKKTRLGRGGIGAVRAWTLALLVVAFGAGAVTGRVTLATSATSVASGAGVPAAIADPDAQMRSLIEFRASERASASEDRARWADPTADPDAQMRRLIEFRASERASEYEGR